MQNDCSEKFILDSNCFITPSKQFYGFNLVPTFWKHLKDSRNYQHLHIIDRVKNELCHEKEDEKKDDIQNWIENHYKGEVLNTSDQDIVDNYRRVLDYVKDCGIYKESAFTQWSNIKVADPWLIATAMKYGYTIVTFEKKDNIQINNKIKSAKIPNVCEHFGVQYCSLYQMMGKLGIII
ncbi:DUF4411 domain-containing protein [Staphylococcus agnetis]|uniref:DUF4411 family protein n=1 Tax=Staphylococcus agnetis TaxID=985762 RepID=UPI000D1B0B79|nr:DUF4411 family protein [Staphylococcus agnetis]PTH13971.1 DUF4411 domain-containing protein [Staphylococcus agnetis]